MAESDFYIKKGLLVNGKATFCDDVIIQKTSVPQSANSTGIQGQIAYDDKYVYICVADDTWMRAELNSW